MTDMLVSKSAPKVTPTAGRPGTWALVTDLARVHAIRMLRHPILLLGLIWYLVVMGIGLPETAYEQYTAVTGMVAFLAGPPAYFAANLVASSGRRSGVDEWSPSLPMPPAHRTAALLLACLAPAAVAAIINLAALLLLNLDGLLMPIAWQHVATVPVIVLGGALLGVAVARLLPWTGVPLALMVGLVAFNAWVPSVHSQLGLYVDFADWTNTDAIPDLVLGSPSWHLVYLVALCGLAASGAFLRDARRPWVPFASGATFGALVIAAGALQLP
jgi:hypothetical protein